MDYLKEGIGLRAMAQRDPLVEYQREGFDMFAAMLDSLKEESVGFLYNLQVQVVPAGEAAPAAGANGAAPVVTAASAAATALSNGGSNGGTPAAAAAGATSAAAATPAKTPVRRRVRPVEQLPTEQAAAAAAVTGGGPAALRGKGLGGPTSSPALTYSGPKEDGGTETRRSGGGAGSRAGAATATGSKEPARNAPCPCGSGKKYKLCHGRPGAV